VLLTIISACWFLDSERSSFMLMKLITRGKKQRKQTNEEGKTRVCLP